MIINDISLPNLAHHVKTTSLHVWDNYLQFYALYVKLLKSIDKRLERKGITLKTALTESILTVKFYVTANSFTQNFMTFQDNLETPNRK